MSRAIVDGIFEVGKKGRVVVGLIEIGVIGCAGYGFDKYRMKLFDFSIHVTFTQNHVFHDRPNVKPRYCHEIAFDSINERTAFVPKSIC